MKRTELARKTPLRPGAPPKRTGRLARKTKLKTRRVSKRFAKLRAPKYCAWIRTHPCVIDSAGIRYFDEWAEGTKPCRGRIECAHVISRGAGGPDVANTVPLCHGHHRQSHDIGARSFDRRYGVSLELKALVYAAMQPPGLLASSRALGEPGRAA